MSKLNIKKDDILQLNKTKDKYIINRTNLPLSIFPFSNDNIIATHEYSSIPQYFNISCVQSDILPLNIDTPLLYALLVDEIELPLSIDIFVVLKFYMILLETLLRKYETLLKINKIQKLFPKLEENHEEFKKLLNHCVFCSDEKNDIKFYLNNEGQIEPLLSLIHI